MQRVRRGLGGFTLLELMIVVAIIAIIAAVAIPNLLSARLNSNEASAVAHLRNIATAQAQFHQAAKADVDRDGTGEYGLFRELSGAVGIRADATASLLIQPLRPPALSGSFRVISVDGTVNRSGHIFRIFLPSPGNNAVSETPTGPLAGAIDTEQAEITWAAYAWPVNYENSGRRTYFLNQNGTMTASDNPAYNGIGGAPPAGAAFSTGGPLTAITGILAIGTVSRDGLMWRTVD